MDNRRLVSIYFLFLTQVFCAQGGFKKQYYLQNSFVSTNANAIETPSGDFVVVGLTYDSLNGQYFNRLTLIGTDPNGNMQWRKDYGRYNFEYLVSGTSNNILDNGFYHATSVRDSTNKYIGVLIKFNYNGDTLWQKVFRDNADAVGILDVTRCSDGGFILTGFFQPPSGDRECLLIKTNSQGTELWRKKITKITPNFQQGSAITEEPLSKRLVVAGYQFIGTATASNTHPSILILDSLGNKILHTTLGNFNGGLYYDVIALKDNNLLTCGHWGGIVNSYYKSKLIKFDTIGNVIWQRNYDTLTTYNGIGNLHERNNGDLVLGGWLDTMAVQGQPEIVKIRITALDKNGNIKWRKYIGSSRDYITSEGLSSLNPTQDGGYIIAAGFAFAPNPRPYSIIKIDSLGCDTLESYCKLISGTGELNWLSDFTFDYFPNPADEKINLRIKSPSEKKCFVTVADIHGRNIINMELKASASSELNSSLWPNGLYFINLLFEGKAIQVKKLVVTH